LPDRGNCNFCCGFLGVAVNPGAYIGRVFDADSKTRVQQEITVVVLDGLAAPAHSQLDEPDGDEEEKDHKVTD